VPDPAGMAAADMTNPQTWNRYAYVTNSPLSRTDSKGLSDCPPFEYHDGCGGCGYYGPGNPGNGSNPGDASSGGTGSGGAGGFGPGGAWGGSVPWVQESAEQLLAESQYDARVALAFALANAAQGDPATAACIAKGLESTFPGSTVTTGGSTGEVGGHWNFTVQLQFSSYDAASGFYNGLYERF
jgi:hypothetical protein